MESESEPGMKPPGALHDTTGGGVSGHHTESERLEFLVAPTTSTERNTVRLRLIPVACWRVDQIRFAFDSSFVTPDITEELKTLHGLREIHKRTDASGNVLFPPLSVFGHADPIGSDDYNKALSGRRATVIYGLLIANKEPDKAVALWQHVARAENWGDGQSEIMEDKTGLPFGTPQSQLLKAYLRKLSPPDCSIGSHDFLGQGADSGGKGDYQGCSEFNPLLIFSQNEQKAFEKAQQNRDEELLNDRNILNQPNRRVLVLLFRAGSKVTSANWPCPRATEGGGGCHKRFWSDGEKRRSTRLPDSERKFDDTEDTFACRFFQRITSKSPCEGLFVPMAIRVVDIDFEPIANMPFELTMGEVKVRGNTSKEGLIVQKLPPDTTTGTLTCDGFTREVAFSPLDDPSTVTGAQPRLLNLAAGTADAQPGVLDEDTQLAIMRFQNDHEMPTSGQLDDATVSKLKERYGS
jgi:Putative peptidoglycan binding domain